MTQAAVGFTAIFLHNVIHVLSREGRVAKYLVLLPVAVIRGHRIAVLRGHVSETAVQPLVISVMPPMDVVWGVPVKAQPSHAWEVAAPPVLLPVSLLQLRGDLCRLKNCRKE